ncbi:hypothetical protein CSUI_003622, partial [Cystoisospora suis]
FSLGGEGEPPKLLRSPRLRLRLNLLQRPSLLLKSQEVGDGGNPVESLERKTRRKSFISFCLTVWLCPSEISSCYRLVPVVHTNNYRLSGLLILFPFFVARCAARK